MKVATISRKRNLMKFTKYSYTFKTAKIANKNYKYITNIIANKLQKEYSHTPFSLCNSKIFNYRYICNYFHREKKHYTIHLTKIVDSKLYFDHNYSSNPVVLKDIHIYMYLFCGRPCRRPVGWTEVSVWSTLNAHFGPTDTAEMGKLLPHTFERKLCSANDFLMIFSYLQVFLNFMSGFRPEKCSNQKTFGGIKVSKWYKELIPNV